MKIAFFDQNRHLSWKRYETGPPHTKHAKTNL